MKRKSILALFICLLALPALLAAKPRKGTNAPLKPRIVVLTDIAPGHIEPDDMESMVRLLAHADLYEIEALIATGGWNSSDRAYPTEWLDSLKTCISAYEKDLPNLMKRSNHPASSGWKLKTADNPSATGPVLPTCAAAPC